MKKFTFDFEHSGSYVLVWLVDDISEDPSDSSVIGIYLEGTDLTIDSFDENNYAELDGIELGRQTLTVLTSNPDAKVYVDGELAENGVYNFKFYGLHEYKIRVVSPDGNSTVEYKLKLNAKPTGRNTDTDVSIPVTYCTLTFETNGGDYIKPLRKLFRTVVNLDKYVPERDGYEFTGWYTDSALTNGVTKVRLTRNMTVYAGWEKISADEEIVEEYEFPFTDIYDRDWFFSDVAYVAQNGLMRGTSSDKFSPYSTTTRAMIVTVLYRMEGEPDAGENSFIDVPDGEYYTDAVAWASENGIVNGYGQGRFGPNDSITREQLTAILYRYSVYKGYDVSVGEDTNILSFNDIAELSDYAYTSMQWACGAGIIGGMGDGRLAPKGNATRCQIAAVLHRYCDNFGE